MTSCMESFLAQNFERFLAGVSLKNSVTKIFEHGDRVHENKRDHRPLPGS